MVVAGDAFKARVSPYHVFIVITPPDENDEAVVVNLTSLKSEEEDQACVLHPADYPDFIRHATVVVYRKTIHGPVIGLENPALFDRMPAVPSGTLRKIQQGALDSDFMRQRFQGIVAEKTELSRSV